MEFILNHLSVIKYTSIFILCFLAIIDGFYDFRNKENGNLTRFGKVALFLILVSGFVAFLIQKSDNEKEQRTEIENRNTERRKDSIALDIERKRNDEYLSTIKKSDSILSLSKLAYTNIIQQYITQQKNHTENIMGLFDITKDLQGVAKNLDWQSIRQNSYYISTIDSLKRVTSNLNAVSYKMDQANYPLAPIRLFATVHIKYNNDPFKNNSMFLEDSTYKNYWFNYYNESQRIEYEFWGFPKIKNMDEFDNFFKFFTLSLTVQNKNNKDCLHYPDLKGKYFDILNGAIADVTNNYDKFILQVRNSIKDSELIVLIIYPIRYLDPVDNECGINSIKEILTEGKLNLKYSLNSYNGNIIVYNKFNASVTAKTYVEKFQLDITKVYFDPKVYVKYGRDINEIKTFNIIPNTSNSSKDSDWECKASFKE